MIPDDGSPSPRASHVLRRFPPVALPLCGCDMDYPTLNLPGAMDLAPLVCESWILFRNLPYTRANAECTTPDLAADRRPRYVCVKSLPVRLWILLALLCGLFVAACGGGDDEREATIPPAGDTAAVAATAPAAGGATVGAGQAETIQDVPLTLNLDQPLPPDFKAAYQRRALDRRGVL